MKTLTSGDIIRACKKDNPIQYLLEKFQYTSDQQLFGDIREIFPVAAENFIRKLKKSIKKTKTDICINENEAETEKIEIVSEEVFLADSSENVVLVELKIKEEELSQKVIQLENQHKDLKNVKGDINKRLQNSKRALEELQRLLKIQSESVQKLSEEFEKCEIEMHQITQTKSLISSELAEVREKITLNESITIFVYKDSTIDIENAQLPEIKEADYQESFSKIINLPEAGELTVNEIRTLAKIQEIVKAYNNRRVEIVFDNPTAQVIWTSINV